MSTISATSSASATSDAWATRKTQMQAKMFAKADTSGDGTVDKSELSALLTQNGAKSASSTDTSAAFTQMDANGNGSLSSDELQQGMEKLRPPRSTVAFAQSRETSGSNPMEAFFSTLDSDGDGSLNTTELKALADQVKTETGVDVTDKLSQLASDNGGTVSKDAFMVAMRPDGPPASDSTASASGTTDGTKGAPPAGGPPPGGGPGGPPPAGGGGAKGTSSVSGTDSSSTTYDALDTNQDGTVSEMERLVGALSASSSASSSDTSAASTTTSAETAASARFDLAQFASHMYAEMARNWSSADTASSTSTLNVVA